MRKVEGKMRMVRSQSPHAMRAGQKREEREERMER